MNIGVGGKLSGGKTTTGVAFIDDFIKETPGKKIISNIQLRGLKNLVFLNTHGIADFIMENKENQEALEKMFFNSILFLDEIRNLISARKSTTNLNEVITQFLMMVGKLDCDVIYTYQLFNSQIDVQLREITDFNFECERTDKEGKSLEFKYARQRIPKDKYGRLIPVLIKIKLMENINDKLFFTGRYFYINPLDYKDYFNTRELVILDRDRYLRSRH